MNLTLTLHRWIGVPTAEDYTKQLIDTSECVLTLDVGCGGASPLSQFRPRIKTVGLDAFPQAIEQAKANGAHDRYVVADVLTEDLDELVAEAGKEFDLVTLFDVIEHQPKSRGYELLERCEELTAKYILLQTPNGFQPQGPEFGNQYHRHLSGWFQEDFEGRGYSVYGTTGTKFLRGYAAQPKVDFPGWANADIVLARLLRIHRRPRRAYNLVAIKDVRGVPARLG